MICPLLTTERRQSGDNSVTPQTTEVKTMARKNKRLKTEYHRGLGFDPRKYITAPVQHHTTEHKPQRGDIWFADLGSHPDSSVQGGIRPVLILQNDKGNCYSSTTIIAAVTSGEKSIFANAHSN